MTEQSQMPLVGPPKRRGWREIVRFRPLTASTNAALVVTRRGRMVSILPAGGPRALSDYLAWPYQFREVDTRERLLVLDQRLESCDSGYEFSISLRLIYQVVQPGRVALELDDVSTELTHAVVQSLRLSGRSFGVDQDKAFEEHLQETLVNGDALVQRIQSLGLVLRRADVAVTLDEPTRSYAEALRFTMRERPLHFQVAIESLEPDRSFDVLVGGTYRLTERRVQDDVSQATESAIQLAITRTLRRVGITFQPGDYTNAAKAMAEVLRTDALLQSELSIVQAQLLRPTVQIQPDRSMVHIPRPNMLRAPDPRPDPMLRRARQSLSRPGRPPALVDTQAGTPQQVPAPAIRRALPPPLDDVVVSPAAPPEPQPEEILASQITPLGELPAPGIPIEDSYALWPLQESLPVMRAPTTLGQPDDLRDADAPWADLIGSAEPERLDPQWAATLSAGLTEPAAPPWELAAVDDPGQAPAEEHAPPWLAASPRTSSDSAAPPPWELAAVDDPDQAPDEEHAPPWELAAVDASAQPALSAAFTAEETKPDLNAAADSDAAAPAPAFLDSDPPVDFGFLNWIEPASGASPPLEIPAPLNSAIADDLGFSLDWSEPELAAPVAEPPISAPAPAATTLAAESDLALEWSKPWPDPSAATWPPHADTTSDDAVIMAHWDDPAIAAPAPAIFSDSPLGTSGSDDRANIALNPAPVFETEPAQSALAQAPSLEESLAAQPDVLETESPALIEQESSPWYAPTMQLGDHLPFDSAADDGGYAPLEAFGMPWVERSAAPGVPSEDRAADALAQTPADEFGQEPAPAIEPATHQPADTGVLPVDEAADATADQLAPPSAPAADAVAQMPAEALAQEQIATIEPTSDLSAVTVEETTAVRSEEPPAIPTEQITRIIGMIQSYGPAWFKMWSLELKERPERLPVVLGEVTADPVMLAQAEDPRVQSALLAALAAYTSPATFPARLPGAAPLPNPALAGQNNDAEDDVPDWLNLRVKWNGHGGGA